MWKRSGFLAVFASLTLGGCLGGTGNDQFLDLSFYERGKLNYDARQYGLAVKHFRSAVDREPGSVEALNGLAASYDWLGRYDLSARYYSRALAANPESPQTLNNIGYSYLLQKRFDLAVAYLRDAQSRDKGDPVVLANRKTAEVAFQEADLKHAAEAARSEQATVPSDRPAEVADTTPTVRITVATAPPARPVSAPREPVKPWIERTAPKIQTLVTQPQFAVVGMAEQAGVGPQLAAYRTEQPKAADLLPDPLVAPLVLDDRPSAGLDGLVLPKVTVAALNPVEPDGDAPLDLDKAEHAPVAGLVVPEVKVASLAPLVDLSEDASLRAEDPDSPSTTSLVPPEVTVVGLDPLDAFEDVSRVSGAVDAAPVTRVMPREVAVASLESAAPIGPIEAAKQTPLDRPVLPLIEVSNGTGRLSMAARIREYLEDRGIVVRRLTNADNFRHMETTIFYRAGWRAYAEDLARLLPAVIDLEGRVGQFSDVRLEIGGDLLNFDRGLYYAVKRSSGGHSS